MTVERVRVLCQGCGVPFEVPKVGRREIRRWCSDACRTRAKRRRRVLVLAEALMMRTASACDDALEALSSEILDARSMEARKDEQLRMSLREYPELADGGIMTVGDE